MFFIDGQTLTGKIPKFGPRPELNFTYRPALPDEVCDYQRAPKGTGKQTMAAIIKLLVGRVQSWDAADARGEPIPVTEEWLRKTPYPVLESLVEYVTGYAVEDQANDAKN